MALLAPVPGSVLTQGFGPSKLLQEPAMFADSRRAYWQPYTGLTFRQHFHAAQDLAAPLGAAIVASEAGTIVYSGIGYLPGTKTPNGGGLVIRVQIRPDVWFESSHCSRVLQPIGGHVARGQVIAHVGATGTATGNHDHFSVLIREVNGGVARTFMYDPRIFLPGGSNANDPRIRPLGPPPPTRYIELAGPGINIRTTPDLDVGSSNVFASSTPSGIYRNGTKIAALGADMPLHPTAPWVTNDDGTWAQFYLRQGYRFCKKELVRLV